MKMKTPPEIIKIVSHKKSENLKKMMISLIFLYVECWLHSVYPSFGYSKNLFHLSKFLFHTSILHKCKKVFYLVLKCYKTSYDRNKINIISNHFLQFDLHIWCEFFILTSFIVGSIRQETNSGNYKSFTIKGTISCQITSRLPAIIAYKNS